MIPSKSVLTSAHCSAISVQSAFAMRRCRSRRSSRRAPSPRTADRRPRRGDSSTAPARSRPEHRQLDPLRHARHRRECRAARGRGPRGPRALLSQLLNALLPDGLAVLAAWGFGSESNIVWHKVRKDGGSDGRGVGFYFRNVTELSRGKNTRASSRASASATCCAASASASIRANPTSSTPLVEGLSGAYRARRPRRAPGLGAVATSNNTYKPDWATLSPYNSLGLVAAE